jgi:5-formyltetrahydrofolate cyclo-ligase
LARLRHSPKHLHFSKDKKISQKIEKILQKHQPKSILFYLPLSLEVSLNSLLKKYRKKVKIYVPFIEGESFKMVEYRLPLEKNSVGILEPKMHSLAQKNVDLIIVPVVGIDKNMQRVGFGKGMYDRFFEKLQKKPIVVFVQREFCHSSDKVCDKYDIKCDYYLTSKETNIK